MPSLAPRTDRDEQSAYIKDIKPSGTDGGTFQNIGFVTRDLNTLILSHPSIAWVTLASNQFTLVPGIYEFEAICPALNVNHHKAKLRDITNSLDVIIGSSELSEPAAQPSCTHSFIIGIITVLATSVFEVQHVAQTGASTFGFGPGFAGFGVDEVYTQVKLKKVG